MSRRQANPRQKGSTLFLTLIMLVVLTIISLATLGTSLMELRMSNNAEAGMAAGEGAQSIMEAVIHDDSNFGLTGNIGSTNCTSNVTCTTNTVAVPAPFDSGSTVIITRLSDTDCPYRNTTQATSCATNKAALFDVYSKLDRSGYGQGRAEGNHGYISLYAVQPGTTIDGPSGVTPLSN